MMMICVMNEMIQFACAAYGYFWTREQIYIWILHACYFVNMYTMIRVRNACIYMSSEWAMGAGLQECTTYQIERMHYIPCNSI